jgi:hypothetical protein
MGNLGKNGTQRQEIMHEQKQAMYVSETGLLYYCLRSIYLKEPFKNLCADRYRTVSIGQR